MILSEAIRLSDQSAVAQARRRASDRAKELGWQEQDIARVALLATEISTNLVKHARDGALLVNALPGEQPSGSVLQILSIDRGPGMANVEQCLQDGFSTAGSPGTGFGAIKRMARQLEIFSTPGKGTVVAAEIRPTGFEISSAKSALSIGGVSVPRLGETANGDAWDYQQTETGAIVVLCDGLGHGPLAAQAAQQALEAFRSRPASAGVREIMIRIHESMRATRGAAAAVALIDLPGKTVRYCGVGNITGVIVDGANARHLVSHNGIVGHSMARAAEFTYPWNSSSMLVMYSDGIGSRWRTDEWPGLWVRSPALISGVLFRDYERGRDDATVVTVKPA